MSYHNGWIARPQERYLCETVALSAALLLGRKKIFADYLTKGRLRTLVVLFLLFQLFSIGSITLGAWLLYRSGVRTPVVLSAYLAVLVPSLAVGTTIARVVFRRFRAAKADARSWPTEPAHDGVYVYAVPLHDRYVDQLQAYLRLGICRDWEQTPLFRWAPRLRRSELAAHHDTNFRHWVSDTRVLFEPGLFFWPALACFLTLNPWWLYFFAAALCLRWSEEATMHWFEWIGQREYSEAAAARDAEAEQKRIEEQKAEEARRKSFVVDLPSPLAPTVQQAYDNLPCELRELLGAGPRPTRAPEPVVETPRARKRPEGGDASDDGSLFPR